MEYRKGRGAQINLQNRFNKTHIDSDVPEETTGDTPSHPPTQVFYDHPKTIINDIKSPDIYGMRSVNPYQGCEHGCIYCYARNSHEYWGFSAGLDFETKIVVKQNAAQLVEKAFLQKNYRPVAISLSGNTDCYQPLERKLQITRSILQVFVKYAHPVGLITKNSLITRDIDLLSELAQQNLVHVYISITTLDEKLRQKLEPRTASAQTRLRTIQTLSEAGIPVAVMTAPIIPGLNDSEIPAILREAAAKGARAAGYTVARINGAVQPIFHDWLHKNFPDRASKVWKQISDLHGGQVNDSQFGRRISGEGQLASSIAQLFKIAQRKFIPEPSLPPYDYTRFRRGGNLQLF